MNIFLKRLLFSLAAGFLAAVIIFILMHFMFVPLLPNESLVAAGDVLTISGTPPITMRLFATDTIESTSLSNENGSISSHPGAMPGYYEFTGTVTPGHYQVSGASATLILSTNGTVDNPGVNQRQQDVTWALTKAMFLVNGLFVLLLSPFFIRNTDPEE